MNATLTLSLPKKEVHRIKKTAKRLGYPTVSGFVLSQINNEYFEAEKLTEESILVASEEAMRLHKQGKLPVLHSIKDLLD